MTEIHFEDLPPVSTVTRKDSKAYQHIAQQLRERPGDWAIIRPCPNAKAASSAAYHIKVGTSPAFRPAGHFEAASRTVDGTCYLYARYTGNGGENDD